MKNSPQIYGYAPFQKLHKVFTLTLLSCFTLLTMSCNNEALSDNIETETTESQRAAKVVPIQNAGFESGKSDWLNDDDIAVSSVTSDGSGIFDGDSKSIKVKSSGKRVAQIVSVVPNTNYVLKAIMNGNGKIGAGSGSTPNRNTNDKWEELSYAFSSGSATSVTIFGEAASSNCRFDNFVLTTDDSEDEASDDSMSIALRAVVNDRYVVAENRGAASLIANRKAIGAWETFYVSDHSDGTISLRTLTNGKYVSATNATTALIANQSTPTATTKFTMINNDNGTISLLAWNGKYVVAEGAGTKALLANRSKIGLWEQFELIVLDGKNDDTDDDSVNNDGTDTIGDYSLDPNKAPNENFDLSKWKITLSSGDEVKVPELNDGFIKANQFYTDPNDGGMVFKNYPKGSGTTTSSSYSRVEFREMLRSYNEDNVDAKGVNANNWVFGSSSNSNKAKAGGFDGVLRTTLKVNRVTTTSEEIWQVGRIIIGQIHAEDDEPCRLYYHKQPNHNKGALYVAHEPSNGGPERFYNLIGEYIDESDIKEGWKYDGAGEPANGIALNQEFSYKIEVNGNLLEVVIYDEDGSIIASKDIDMSNSGYENSWVYYKAGLYSGNKTVQSSSDHEKVTFYSLSATHKN